MPARRPRRPTKRPADPTFLTDLAAVGDPSIDPDGDRVAYLRGGIDPATCRPQSWIESLSFDGGRARRLTRGPGDGQPRWSPDGAELAFVRRAEGEAPQTWILPAAGGEAERLSSLTRGVSWHTWAPGGDAIYAVATVDLDPAPDDGVPRPRVVSSLYYRGDTLGWQANLFRHLFRIDRATGESKQLTSGEHNHGIPVVSPDGRWLAFASTRAKRRQERMPFGYELCVMRPAGGKVRRVVEDTAFVGGIAWSDDGDRIACVLAEMDDPWQAYLWLVDVKTGERRRLTSDSLNPQAGFFPVLPPPPIAWTRDGIRFVADAGGKSGLYLADLRGRVRPIRDKREAILGFATTADARRMALAQTAPTVPPEVALLDDGGAREVRKTSANRPYRERREIGKVERFRLRRGDLSIDCGLVFPPGFSERKRYPLVLEIHGGPNSFFPSGFNPLHQLIAGAGHIVLFVNPRGSTTYGEDFAGRVIEDWGGEDYLDLMAAVDQVCARRYVDGDRLGLHGYSYGGYMSSWIVGQTTRFKAAVVGAPVTNLMSMYGTTDIGAPWGRLQWGGRPADNLAHYMERSPITYAGKVKTPVLLLHGEEDHRCPIGQSEEYFVALKERGKKVEMVRYPDCSHLFLRVGPVPLREDYYRRVIEWLGRYL